VNVPAALVPAGDAGLPGAAARGLLCIDERIVEVDDTACALLGVPRDRLLGRAPGEFSLQVLALASDDPRVALERVAAAARAGVPQSFVWQCRVADTLPGWFLADLRRGTAAGVLELRFQRMLLTPVGARIAVDATEHAARIFDRAGELMYFRDPQGRFTFVNDTFLRWLGLDSAAEVLGRTEEEVFCDGARADYRSWDNDRTVLANPRLGQFEETLSLDGNRRTLLSIKGPVFGAAGELGAVFCMGIDVSASRRIERAMRQLALDISSVQGETVLRELTGFICQSLEVDFALIGRMQGERIETLATSDRSGAAENFCYPIAGTPCETVWGKDLRIVCDGLASLYPGDSLATRFGYRSYAGLPLFDSAGAPIGIIAVLHRRPLADTALVETLLRIYSVRAAAEIERLRVETALREAEGSYRAIFDAAEDPIFLHDWETGAILDVNAKACAVYGYGREQLINARVDQISSGVEPYTGARAAEWLEQARREGSVQFEWHRRSADGSLQWDEVRLKSAVIGGKRQLLAFTRQITERKLAEEALRASEEQYRAIFNAIEDALILWDAQFRRVDVNAAYERIFGWRREEVLGQAYDNPVYPGDYASPRLDMVRRALDGESCYAELEAIRRNGERFPSEVLAIPFTHGGQPHVLAIARDITARKRTEAALRASEEQYRAIFNASADALMLWNSRLQRCDVNAAHERIFGFSREEIVGRGFEGLPYPEELVRPRIDMVRRALAGEACVAELDALRKDGQRIVTELRAIPFQHHGEPHVLQIARDVTEGKRAEAALRASEEQYRAIFGASTDGLLLVDRRARVIDLNPALTQMFGYTPAELAGGSIRTLAAEPDSPKMQGMLQAIGNGEAFETEGVGLRRDGSRFPVNARATPMTYRGEVHLLVTIRDITRRIEEQQRLVRSEQRLRATIESALDCIIATDADGRVIEFNPMAEATFRIPAQDALGRDMTGLLTPPRLREAYRAAIAGFLAGERPDLAGRRIEVSAQRGDGEEFEAELTLSRTESAEGRIFIAFLRDLTEQKAAAAQREQLQAQLRQAQKMEAIGHLAGGIAHDFNNLLTSLTGYVAMAQDRLLGIGEQKAARHLEKSLRSAERARNLVQQLLVFSRGQRGDRVAIDLARHLGEFEELLRSTLPSSVSFDTDYEPDLPPVMVDPTQLDQVLMNLCINARDAMDSRGALRVSVRNRSLNAGVCSACRKTFSGSFIELSVRDSGQGITPEVLERMFDPFFTTKQAGKGTGMGLSTTHGIVHDYGGHILVDTGAGRGTAFNVLLPPATGVAALPADPRGQGVSTRADGGLRGTVLLVDDDAHVLEYMDDQLREWGLQVRAFGDPRAALEAVSGGELGFDVALLDQTMPGMSGLQLAKSLAALLPDPRIILYTGYSEPIHDDDCRDCEVIGILHKPIDHARLHALLRQHLPR
jgi:PAS domain S-box-containing protein